MRTLSRSIVTVTVLLAVSTGWAQQEPQGKSLTKAVDKAPAKSGLDRAQLEKKLAKDMTNVVLTGSFTITGRQDDKLRKEKYTILSAAKAKNDQWIFTARIQYGNQDVTLPIPIQVKWAGDTPILQLTKMAIPGMGTFTTRVVIYEDHYAGMWWHDKVGGHLFGTITPIKEQPKGDPSATEKPDEKKTPKK